VGCHTRAGHWWPCGSGTALVAFGMMKEGWHASVEGREVRLQAWLRCLMSCWTQAVSAMLAATATASGSLLYVPVQHKAFIGETVL
jgi:hypothetical protein